LSGPTCAPVTITGANFSSVTNENIVYFGAVRAPVISASFNSLTVTVPPGATYAPITVTTASGLIAFSSGFFLPSFGGTDPIDPLSFSAPEFYLGVTGSRDIHLADTDVDGKPDLVVGGYLRSGQRNLLEIYRNRWQNVPTGLPLFDPVVAFPPTAGTIGLDIGDLDGDGLLDAVVADGLSNLAAIYRNANSQGSVVSPER
jgi:hypothetical protein